jgi:predicted transcriptional regulator
VSNSKLFLDFPRQTRVLLSIKPQFASAILRGEKKYEFRRSIFSRQVDVVLVYATKPVQQVICEFDVVSIICEPLPALWRRTRRRAGIDEASFYGYFDGLDTGYAIVIGEVRSYDEPFSPVEKLGLRPPQSFIYLDS